MNQTVEDSVVGIIESEQGEEWINENMINEHPWMNSVARNKALDSLQL